MKTILLAALFLCATLAHSQITLQTNTFASGFDGPVAITNAGDNRLFVVERPGRIIVVSSTGVKAPVPFLDIDSIVNNGNDERGLLGLAFDPAYASNGYFFVYYIDNNGNSQIARYSRDPNNPDHALANSRQPVLSVTQPVGFTNHKGGNLVFGEDGFLYCGFGDGGDAGDPLNNAQNGQTLLGKLIRIDVSSLPYSIPPSNPFTGSAPLDEIWALGLRNPWRWSFDRLTNDLWIADVGQGDWEEINFTPAGSTGGENYGWRCYEGLAAYNTSGCSAQSAYEQPIYVYPHSGPNSGCSATGGFVYRGAAYSSLFGKYIFSDYCSGNIWSLDAAYNLTDYGSFGFGPSSFGENVYGELFMANVDNGIVYSISTNECNPVAYIMNADTSFLCTSPVTLQALEGPGLTYQWLRNSFPIPGAVNPTYSPNVASSYQVIVTNQNGCSSTSAARIVVNNKPAAQVTGDPDFCIGESASLAASPGTGYSYQWLKNNVTINGATSMNYVASLAGNYRVLVTSSNGCTRLSNPFKVTGPPQGGTNLMGPGTICQGDSVEIVAKATGTNFTYQWLKNNTPIPLATSQNYFIGESGYYMVTVTNQYGCTKTGSGKAINVISCNRNENNVSWSHYSIYNLEGKLLESGSVSESEQSLIPWLQNKYEGWKGIYFVRLNDQNYREQKFIKVIF